MEQLVRFDFCAASNSRSYAPVVLGIWCADWETGFQGLGKHTHFEVLTPVARGVCGAPEPPRYDVSWIIEVVKTA